MGKKFLKVKVKNFLKKTRAEAMEHLGLSAADYDKIVSFIKDNNLVENNMLHIYPDPEGHLCVQLSAKDAALTSSSPDIPTSQKVSDDNKVKPSIKPSTPSGGNYIVTTMQPGMAPYVQSCSTNQLVTTAMGVVSLMCGIAYLTWQCCNIAFTIIDRRAARANAVATPNPGAGPNTNTNTPS